MLICCWYCIRSHAQLWSCVLIGFWSCVGPYVQLWSPMLIGFLSYVGPCAQLWSPMLIVCWSYMWWALCSTWSHVLIVFFHVLNSTLNCDTYAYLIYIGNCDWDMWNVGINLSSMFYGIFSIVVIVVHLFNLVFNC